MHRCHGAETRLKFLINLATAVCAAGQAVESFPGPRGIHAGDVAIENLEFRPSGCGARCPVAGDELMRCELSWVAGQRQIETVPYTKTIPSCLVQLGEQVRDAGDEARKERGLEGVLHFESPDAGRLVNEDLAVGSIDEPDFLSASRKVFEDFSMDVDGPLGGREYFNGNVRGEGNRDFVEIDCSGSRIDEERYVGAANGSFGELRIDFAESAANRIASKIGLNQGLNPVTDFCMPGCAAGQGDQFTFDEFVVFGVSHDHLREVFDGHPRFRAHVVGTCFSISRILLVMLALQSLIARSFAAKPMQFDRLSTGSYMGPERRNHRGEGAEEWMSRLLLTRNEFFPIECKTDRTLYFLNSMWWQLRNFLEQVDLRDRSQIVEIYDTRLGHSFGFAQGHFDRNVTDRSGNLSSDHLVEDSVSVISTQQRYGPTACWLGQFRPPDLVLFQAFHSSALDQSSASSVEFGWRKYASRIASYSRFRIAALTAWRMNSARCLLAAGAILFSAFNSGSSN